MSDLVCSVILKHLQPKPFQKSRALDQSPYFRRSRNLLACETRHPSDSSPTYRARMRKRCSIPSLTFIFRYSKYLITKQFL